MLLCGGVVPKAGLWDWTTYPVLTSSFLTIAAHLKHGYDPNSVYLAVELEPNDIVFFKQLTGEYSRVPPR